MSNADGWVAIPREHVLIVRGSERPDPTQWVELPFEAVRVFDTATGCDVAVSADVIECASRKVA